MKPASFGVLPPTLYVKDLKKMGKTTANLKNFFRGATPRTPHHSAFLKSCGERWHPLRCLEVLSIFETAPLHDLSESLVHR